jgi:hypothetical protein
VSALPLFGPFAVYFSFADGALGYDCDECGYRCCRGASFGATQSEMVQLGKHYPRLPMFVQPQRDPNEPLVGLQNFAPSCFFLGDNGHCRIQTEHGRALKPYVCRVFPANQLQRSGVILFVSTNFLCPLRPAREGDARVRYADIIADLQASIEVPTQLPSTDEALLPEALLTHEAFLRDLPIDEDLLTRIARCDVMSSRWDKEPKLPSAAIVSAHRAHLIGLRQQMSELLGLEKEIVGNAPRFARELAIMMPRLRLQLLRARPPAAPIADYLALLGRPLLALTVYLELMASLGTPITLAGIDHAWRAAQSFCEVLAAIDRVPTLTLVNEEPLVLFRTQEAAMQRFLRFVHEENPRRRLSLGEVLSEIDLPDPAARAQLCQSFTREALARFSFEPK